MDSPAPAPVDPELAIRVREGQVALLHERSGSTLWAGLAATLVVAALLWSRVPQPLLLGWLLLRLALFGARLGLHARGAGHGPAVRTERWRRRHALLTVLDGASWGLGACLLAPHGADALLTLLLLATLIAIVAATGSALAPSAPLHAAYLAAVLLPPIAQQLWQATPLGLSAGAGLLLYGALQLYEGRVAGRQVRELLRLRLLLEREADGHRAALALAERHSAGKSQFLATMSHEMRTPLHGMLGLARQLGDASGPEADAARRRAVALIERSGEHLLGLISDVLDFARIEAGRLELADAPFDLITLIDEVAALAGGSARDKALVLEVETDGLGPAGGWVRGDAVRVRQVLHNLLGNAVKFTERGAVQLRALRESGAARVRIEVEDSGRGIAPAALERVFDAFHQTDGDFDRRHGGAGLGLTIARELAQAMGGSLQARSRLGVGSVFVFELPLPPAQPETQPPPAADLPAPPRLLGRVLVAEDNAVNALVAEAMLREIGVEVELVVNGAQAVQRWERGRPDLVLMDCQMPELDGFAATRAIRAREATQRARRVPIVALTANAFESDRERCLAAGMDEHLAKPFRAEELRTVLARYLAPADARGAGPVPPACDIPLA